METPPPDATVPPGPPERRCPRCGSTLAPDQEWCLSCGAAAGTEVVEARGWRVPLYLGGGLAALAVIGVILAIVALASRKEESPSAQATPAPSAQPPGSTPTPLPTLTPAPSATTDPSLTPTPTVEASPTAEASPTEDPFGDSGDGTGTDGTDGTGTDGTDGTGTDSGTGTLTTVDPFAGWTIGDGYTVIIESSSTQSGAKKVAQSAEASGETVGILKSDEFSSLNAGYWVVFSGEYASKSEAEEALEGIKANHSDAYVRKITPAS